MLRFVFGHSRRGAECGPPLAYNGALPGRDPRARAPLATARRTAGRANSDRQTDNQNDERSRIRSAAVKSAALPWPYRGTIGRRVLCFLKFENGRDGNEVVVCLRFGWGSNVVLRLSMTMICQNVWSHPKVLSSLKIAILGKFCTLDRYDVFVLCRNLIVYFYTKIFIWEF